jgi:hypothetical protein
MRVLACVLAVLLAGAATERTACADNNDLSLARLGTLMPPENGSLPLGAATPDAAARSRFRSLASELGVVLAPRLSTPADTIGFGGFQLSFDFAFTEISADADFWDAARRVDPDPTRRLLDRPPGMMPTIGMFVRKGIWLPLPSFEIGAGAIHITESNMWALQAYAKLALQEGFDDWPIPSLAVRGSGSRLMGSEDLDLTVAGLDVSISKSFGIGGTVTLHPYAGWNVLWIIPRSNVLDATPWCDAFRPDNSANDPMHFCPMPGNPTDLNANFVFPEQPSIMRQRVFVGAKLKVYVFALTAEWDYTPAGTSTAEGGTVRDRSGDQQTVAFSAALDY